MGGRQAPVPAWALHVPATKALKLDIASKKKKLTFARGDANHPMSFLAHKHHSQKNIWTRGGGDSVHGQRKHAPSSKRPKRVLPSES